MNKIKSIIKEKIKKEKLLHTLKENWPIILLVIISSFLHLLVFKELGYMYTLKSDDLSYIKSGIEFFKSGRIIMHGVLTAQIMPGMTFLIALFCLIFGTGSKLWIALKFAWIIMGILTIVVVYKTIKMFTNKYIAVIPCLFFFSADYLWMNNTILTETPFILLFSLLIYHTLKLEKTKSTKDYVLIVIYYIIAVFIRPNIGIFPIFIVIYLLLNKYDFKLLFKQCLIAGVILIMCIIPWTYRNYQVFDKFIPLTYGMGNPLLLGTYQGVGYPSDEELNYVKNVDSKMSDEMKFHLNNPDKQPHLSRYYRLEYDGMKAKYRMKYWWKNDKMSMIKSYLIYKPYGLIYNCFYWAEVLNVKTQTINLIRKYEIILFLICSVAILINKKYFKELLFLGLIYITQVALYAYTFSFGRYAVSLFFIRYIVIGIGLYVIYTALKNWRSKKNESINDNSSVQRRTKHRKYSKENNKLQPKIKK